MIRKMTAFVVALVIVLSMCAVPASASSFTETLFFDADYNKGVLDDGVDAVEGVEEKYEGDAAEFVDDATIGRKVLKFKGSSAIGYDIDYNNVIANFTMEAYVNMDKAVVKTGAFCLIAGTFWHNSKSGFGLAFSSFSADGANIGKAKVFSSVSGNQSEEMTIGGNKYAGGWKHLVYVHDGADEYLYEDGVLVATQAASAPNLPSDPAQKFRIGGYNFASQFCSEADIAYVRLYGAAAEEAEVTELYETRDTSSFGSGDAPVGPSGDPTDVPEDEPTDEPADEPTQTPGKQDNTKTFDLGLVSLAAVALSSTVVLKKKKK